MRSGINKFEMICTCKRLLRIIVLHVFMIEMNRNYYLHIYTFHRVVNP